MGPLVHHARGAWPGPTWAEWGSIPVVVLMAGHPFPGMAVPGVQETGLGSRNLRHRAEARPRGAPSLRSG